MTREEVHHTPRELLEMCLLRKYKSRGHMWGSILRTGKQEEGHKNELIT